MKLYDAARCPYCARVRLVLHEKQLEYETIEIDLGDRPQWIYDLNPTGRVPVLDDGFVLPESEVIMAYLEERYPDPPLLPADLRNRARARLAVHRLGDTLTRDYYAARRGAENALEEKLAALEVGISLYSDFAMLPWVLRARDMLGIELPEHLERWVDELSERPAVQREVEVVAAL